MLDKLKGKKLYRSRENRKIAGVCGGIAEYLEIDPSVVRIIWILMVLIGGPGILLYIIAWILLDEKPEANKNT